MRIQRSRQAALVLLSAGALTLTACSSGGGTTSNDAGDQEKRKTKDVSIGTAKDSQGPVKKAKGARKGGTAYGLDRKDFDHLDPGQVYVSDLLEVSKLFSRRLTAVKDNPDGGQTLVGDLATDTGKSSNHGKTWTFKLKKGLKYEDGSTIKAQDIKYAAERQFKPYINQGPTYIPEWLAGKDYRDVYKKKGWDKKGLPDSLIETPNDRTIIYHLKKPHSDFNFTVSMPISTPVPKDKDTKAKYDNHPVSSGPYKIKKHVQDKSLVFVRNKYWDPKTDPLRPAYPDKFKWEFGLQNAQSDQRLIAANGKDKYAFTMGNQIAPENMSKVQNTPELKKRTLNAPGPYAEVFNINTTRIKDIKVRKALIKAFPKKQARLAEGGPWTGKLSTTAMNPNVKGWKDFDLYDSKPTGDPKGAKKLLKKAGKPHPKIVYAYGRTDVKEKQAVAIVSGLEKAGFKVVKKPIADSNYYDQIGNPKNKYDLYWGGWGTDWPTGTTALPPIYDGRKIFNGSPNYTHLNDPEVNKKFDEVLKMSDPEKAAKGWQEANKLVMSKAPVVPYKYSKRPMLIGPGLGGGQASDKGMTDVSKLWVKKSQKK